MDFFTGLKMGLRAVAMVACIVGAAAIFTAILQLIVSVAPGVSTLLSGIVSITRVALAVASYYIPGFSVIWGLFVAYVALALIQLSLPLLIIVRNFVYQVDEG